MSKSKDRIIGALRGARVPASMPLPPLVKGQELFANYPDKGMEFKHFAACLEELYGECFKVESERVAGEKILELIKESPYRSYMRSDDPLIDKVLDCVPEISALLGKPASTKLEDTSGLEASHYDIGITTADALVVRTGSVVLRANAAGGRRLSVLPHLHIILARDNQFVPSLEDWFSTIQGDPSWSYATIITGPSRTADIEKILVLGAHGPKRLVVIIIRN